MWVLTLIVCSLLSGFYLFRKNTIAEARDVEESSWKLSVIIPARNEATNLPLLLKSLQAQTLQPYEIIVVNDHSEDRTRAIAEEFGVRVIDNPPLPPGWTGKNWAVWNGYQQARGDVFAFVDADVRLAPDAFASLAIAYNKTGGAISVVPYHAAGKFREKFTMVLNVLGVFAFTSPMEPHNPNQGLYGSLIITSREEYERIGGHQRIRSEVLDDLNLGGLFKQAGLPVTNYIGYGLVQYRMYPDGLLSALEGFAKSAALSTAKLKRSTVLLVAVWVVGLIVSECFLLFAGTSYFFPLLISYLLFSLQLFYLNKYVGDFGFVHPLFHVLSTLFFLVVMLYSLYQVSVHRKVIWKGRSVDVGGGPS